MLARHPRLVAVIAHLGMPDYADFLDLAERYDRVHLDTTMAFTDFTEQRAPFPPELRPRLQALGSTGWSSAATSRTRRTPTRTSSRRSCGSTWGTTGCARCCTTPAELLRLVGRDVGGSEGVLPS